ncbi:MAG TPA: FxsA family protein [Casimicrobiaceae bacterium]|nr:FxsA family protein [Casimicrobiaceae bacterium]
MRFVVMLIVLIFPVLDLLATIRFARWTGIPTLAWLLASAIAGSLLLRHEIVTFRVKTLAALRGDEPLLRGLLDSGRKVLAALLLILPGIVSDLIALTLLSLPFNLGSPLATQTIGSGRRTIDSDYRRID